MVNFRYFVSAALLDPILTPPPPMLEHSRPKLVSRLGSMPKSDQENAKSFVKETILMESDIPTQPDGTSFINPALLSSRMSTLPGPLNHADSTTLDDLNIENHFHRIKSSQSQSQNSKSTSLPMKSAEKKEMPTVDNIFARKFRSVTSSTSSANSSLTKTNVTDICRSASQQDNLGVPPKHSSKFLLGSFADLGSTPATDKSNQARSKVLPLTYLQQSQRSQSDSTIKSVAEQGKRFCSSRIKQLDMFLADAIDYSVLILGDECRKHLVRKMNEMTWKTSSEVKLDSLGMLCQNEQPSFVD